MACYHFTIKTNEKPNGGCVDAANHADYINREGKYKDIDNRISSSAHADYINRDDKFAHRGGCVYHDHHLPRWAHNSPKRFFDAADKYESSTVTYREIEFALPEELSLSQNKEIVNEFLNNHLKDFYYAYAIHDKHSTITEGHKNMHVHIMFSERKIDDQERFIERTPDLFFKKANRNDYSRGGCKKDSKWNGAERKKYLFFMRKDFAMIQNKFLEKNGFDIRVDHRSLKMQRDIALKNGDITLAKILDRLPEKHIGPEIAADPNHPAVLELKQYRQIKAEHQKLIYASDIISQHFNAEKLKSMATSLNKRSTTEIENSENISVRHIQKNILNEKDKRNFVTLRANIVSLSKEIAGVEPFVISYTQALKKAKEQLMNKDEKDLINHAAYIQSNIKKYTNLLKELDSSSLNFNADHKEIATRLSKFKGDYNSLLPDLRHLNKKFSVPKMKTLLTKTSNSILKENKFTRDNLKELNTNLSENIKELHIFITSILNKEMARFKGQFKNNPESIFVSNNNKKHFTSKEILNVFEMAAQSYQAEIKICNTEINILKTDLKKLSSKVFSKGRAIAMAKNIFTKGRLKSLRIKDYALKKEETALESGNKVFDKNTVTDMHNRRMKLTEDFSTLEKICSNNTEKINLIAQNILQDNKPFANYYKEVESNIAFVQNRLQNLLYGYKGILHMKPNIEKFVQQDNQLKTSKGKINYTIKTSAKNNIYLPNNNQSASLNNLGNTHTQIVGQQKTAANPIKAIAAAMSSPNNAADIVARLDEKYNEFEWTGLTAIDKKIQLEKMSHKSMELGL